VRNHLRDQGEHTSCDVLVVGAGPAGLTAAITLARFGVDVLLVERHPGTSPFPKATGVSTRTMELFRSWGIEAQIRAGAMQVRPVMTVSRTLVEAPMFAMPFGYPTNEQAMQVSPCTPCCCAQDHLEPVLLEHLLGNGGRVLFGVEMTGMAAGSDGVSATIRDRTSGRVSSVRAGYVIGADGPRSAVREAAGIGMDDLGTIGDFVAVTFRAELMRRMADSPSALNSVEIAGAEGVFVPTDPSNRWIYAREWHPGNGDRIEDWTPEVCTDLIRRAAGVPDLQVEILTVMPFVMGGHLAENFGRGRMFLVGDAAHRTTPVGGTGMNMAIHAANNLGWKLAWVLKVWAAADLLASYEPERRPVATSNVLRSLRRGPAPAFGADDGLAGDVGVCYRSAVIDDSELRSAGVAVGTRAPHAWIQRNNTCLSMLDLYDGRLTVLTGVEAEQWQDAVDDLAGSGLPIAVVTPGRDVQARDGELARRYALGANEAVLIRPDGYVAWRGDGGQGGASGALRDAVAMALGGDVVRPVVLRRAG